VRVPRHRWCPIGHTTLPACAPACFLVPGAVPGMIDHTQARRYVVHDHAERDTDVQPTRPVPARRRTSVAGQGAAEVLRLQRTAGNAAVAGLLQPTVQRAVEIDELETTADTAGPAAPAGSTGVEGITSEGGVVTIDAAAVNINAPIVRASGVLQTDTLVAQNVVGASYTPGAGNVM
jgi:hypothetical protein